MSARMWKIQWVALGLLVIAGGCGSPNDKNAGFSPRQKGLKMPADSSRMADAIAPNILPETHVAAGRLHESEGRLARAAEQYRLAIAVKPDNVEAYNRLGIVLDQLGKFREADQCLQRAIQIAPQQAHLHNNLAFSYIMQGRWAEAQGALDKALAIDPNFVRARVNMGTVLAQQGKFDEAFRNFRQVLRTEDAYYNVGLMYQSKQRAVEAAQAFKQALAANPKMIAAKKRLDLLPPGVVSEAEDRGSIFAFTAALTGQTPKDVPATRPSVAGSADVMITQPVPTTQPEPESIQLIVPRDATDAIAAAQPSSSTQPAASEISTPGDLAAPIVERTSTAADMPEIRLEPATQPAAIAVTVIEAEPAPATQPEPETAESTGEPVAITAPQSTPAASPVGSTRYLAKLAHPTDLIRKGIEPIGRWLSRILPAAIADTDTVASPLPTEVSQPRAEEVGIEVITVSPNP